MTTETRRDERHAPPDRPSAQAKSGHEERGRKRQVLKRPQASVVRSISDAVVVKNGEPFFLCPPDGQIDLGGKHGFGLYHHDTRFLSGYRLSVAGIEPWPLAAAAPSGQSAILELTNPETLVRDGHRVEKDRLGIRWDRDLSGEPPELCDTVTVRSFGTVSTRAPVRVQIAADFDDVFRIRGLLDARPGQLEAPRWDGDDLVFTYRGKDGVVRTLTASFDPKPAKRGPHDCELDLDVPARGHARASIRLRIREHVEPGAKPIERRARGQHRRAPVTALHVESDGGLPWAGGEPWGVAVRSNALLFDSVLARSLDDLGTLRGELDGHAYYVAGVPWFSTLFGRDSLISAWQTLPFDLAVAADTLRLLAGRQGTKDDAWRDEEPGKILHELRIGELARLDEIPQTPYYGTVDATPLFLLLLTRHAAWTGSLDLFHDLRSHVDRALGWIDRTMDRGGGYLAYSSTTQGGLVNQGWKDSGDAIVDADGAVATPPIALPEVQAYVHEAWTGLADLFERDGDDGRAADLRRRGADLRERFERDFWSDELGCYVLALAKDGQPCQVVASNAGQVLLSGLPSPEHAAAVADRLMKDDMFNGWGIRTLATSAAAYNPIGYHLGTVWPHDNSLIAEGFRRHGRDDAADRILASFVEASGAFGQQRLPECFAGFERKDFGIPVRYPVACHPQAWAAGSIPHLLTVTLGLTPEAFDRRLRIVRPRLPPFVDRLEIRGLPVGSDRLDLTFTATDGKATVDVVNAGGIDVRVEE
ncbi:MAG TPA: glycogen debranching N-terminal domain-containing protein, partial [Candidatus Limnocylindrales bacterium]|nr:glycogen debranching N-terminal domain-containing protein [Candidatus Limnocylindrales bacterium]